MPGQGQIYSFSDTLTTRRSIANVISIVDPRDVPMVSFLGTKNQGRHNIQNWPNHAYSWMQDTLRVRTAQINGAVADTGETDITVDAGHSIRFKPGDVWKFDANEELFWVSNVNTTTHVVSGTRNYGNALGAVGTGVAILDNATMTYQYSARLEGDDSDPQFWTTPTEVTNYSQIFHAEIRVTGSEENATTRYGIADQYDYQIKKLLGGSGAGDGKQGRAGDLLIDLENTFFRGRKVQRSETQAGAMGGFKAFVTTNVTDLNGAAVTLDDVEAMAQSIWDAGGAPDTIVCNAYNKRLISSWFADSVRTTRNERTGGVTISEIETEFGNFDIMLNRRCPPSEIYFLQRDKVGWVTLRDWAVEPLAVSGDYRKDEIVGEFGFILENETSHGLIIDTAIA